MALELALFSVICALSAPGKGRRISETVQGGEKVGHWSGGMMLLRAV